MDEDGLAARLRVLAINTLIYGSGLTLSRVLSVLLLPVFTRFLSPVDYGVTGILSVLTLFLSPVFALGVGSSMGIVYFEHPEHRWKLTTVWTSFALLAASATALLAVASIFRAPLVGIIAAGEGADYDFGYLLTVAIGTVAATVATQPLLVSLQLARRARAFVSLTVGGSLAGILLSLFLVVDLHRGVSGLLEGSLLGQIVTFVAALPLALDEWSPRFDVPVARELLRLGVPLVPAFFFIFVMQQGSRYIVEADLGLGAVGLYTLGSNLGMVLTLVVGGFGAAWLPFFMSYSARQEEGSELFGQILTYYVLAIGSLSLMFFALARLAVLVLTRDSFHGAFVAVGPFAASQFLIGIHSILLAGMYFAREVRFQALIQGAAAMVTVLLALALTPLLGIRGASLAVLLGFGSLVAIQYAWNIGRRYVRIPYDWTRLRRFGVVYVVYVVVFMWDRDLPLLGEAALAAIGVAALVMVLYRLLSPSERLALRSAFVRIGALLPSPRGHL